MKGSVYSILWMVLAQLSLANCPGAEQRITVAPGQNVQLGIVVFPPSVARQGVVDFWTVADIFGPENEAGILAGPDPVLADLVLIPGEPGEQRTVFFSSSEWLAICR